MIKLALFFLFSIFFYREALAGSYSFYEMDDLSFTDFGRNYFTTGRLQNQSTRFQHNKYSILDSTKILYTNYGYSRFYSQKGGDKETDSTEKYTSVSGFKSEAILHYDSKIFSTYLLLAPNYKYIEKYHRKKERFHAKDSEAIYGFQLNTNKVLLVTEIGRGYQRLDYYGLFFSGMANYIEQGIYIKNLNSHLSILGLSYSADSILQPIGKNQKENNLYGISFRKENISIFEYINIFHYTILETKQTSYNTDTKGKGFKPYGKIQYIGLESLFRAISNLDFATGLIYAKGYRDKSDSFYKSFLDRTDISSFLIYFIGEVGLENWNLYGGILYTSKDKKERKGNTDNGFSGVLTDPRIFGGMGSFLLTHNIDFRNPPVFTDLGDVRRPSYTNLGMQIVSFGLNYKGILSPGLVWNYGYSQVGKGFEILLNLKFSYNQSSFNSFGLLSLAKAFLAPFQKESFLYDEWKLAYRYKEFTRFYISCGIQF